MVSRIKLWTTARSEVNAHRLGQRVFRHMNGKVALLGISPYPKTKGYVLLFELQVQNTDWNNLVIEVIQAAQELGYSWTILGSIREEVNLTTTKLKLPGIEMAEVLLIQDDEPVSTKEISPVERRILELIEQHNGEWYWYQIDRAISTSGLAVGPFNKELQRLKEQGLYTEEHSENRTQATYWITDKGREVLTNEEQKL